MSKIKWAGFLRLNIKDNKDGMELAIANRHIARYGVPKGVRTPVTAVKGQCPRPLDDGDRQKNNSNIPGRAKRVRTADP